MACKTCKGKDKGSSSASKAAISNPKSRPNPRSGKAPSKFRGGSPFPKEDCSDCKQSEQKFMRRIDNLKHKKIKALIASLKKENADSDEEIEALELYALGLIKTDVDISRLIDPIEKDIANLINALLGNNTPTAPLKG